MHLRPQPQKTSQWSIACDLAHDLGLSGIPSPNVWAKVEESMARSLSNILEQKLQDRAARPQDDVVASPRGHSPRLVDFSSTAPSNVDLAILELSSPHVQVSPGGFNPHGHSAHFRQQNIGSRTTSLPSLHGPLKSKASVKKSPRTSMEAELVWPSADTDPVNLRRTRDGHDDFTVEVSSQLLSQPHERQNLKQNAQALQVSQLPVTHRPNGTDIFTRTHRLSRTNTDAEVDDDYDDDTLFHTLNI